MSVHRQRLVPGLAGVAGVVVAHVVDYLVAFPDGGSRAEELRSTGHAYWPVALVVGLLAAVVALVTAATRGARNGLRGRPGRSPRDPWWQRLGWLAAWQLGLFTALEVGERVLAGEPALALLHEREFGVGLAIQVVVAAAALVILFVVERGAERVAAQWRTSRLGSRRRIVWQPVAPEAVHVPKLWRSDGARAPPRPIHASMTRC